MAQRMAWTWNSGPFSALVWFCLTPREPCDCICEAMWSPEWACVGWTGECRLTSNHFLLPSPLLWCRAASLEVPMRQWGHHGKSQNNLLITSAIYQEWWFWTYIFNSWKKKLKIKWKYVALCIMLFYLDSHLIIVIFSSYNCLIYSPKYGKYSDFLISKTHNNVIGNTVFSHCTNASLGGVPGMPSWIPIEILSCLVLCIHGSFSAGSPDLREMGSSDLLQWDFQRQSLPRKAEI